MARKRDNKSKAKNVCPLTTSNSLRAAADKQAASIKAGFPPGVSQPALRALAAAGFTNVDQLAKVREEDLANLHGVGPKAVELIRTALESRGKSFRS